MFISGLIVGLLISILIFVLEIYLKQRNLGLGKLENIIRENTGPRGKIIFPKTEAQKHNERVIAKNELLNKETNIEELL